MEVIVYTSVFQSLWYNKVAVALSKCGLILGRQLHILGLDQMFGLSFHVLLCLE